MKTTLFAGASSRANTSPSRFSHLSARAGFLGLGHLAGRRAGKAETDEDEEARKARRAEEDKVREEEDARRAEEDQRREEEDARRAEEDDGENEDEEARKARRAEEEKKEEEARRAEQEENDKGEEKGRKAERARWGAVLSHANAAGRVAAACAMLEEGDTSAEGIVRALASLPRESGRQSLGARMQGVVDPDVRGGAERRSPAQSAAKTQASEFLAVAHRANPGRVVAPGSQG